MVRVHKTALKLFIFVVVIMFSLMSGALLHAYAGSSDHTSASGPAQPSAGAAADALLGKNAERLAVQVTVDVCPGDTLWDIASAHLPEGENVRSYISKIKKTNHMKSSDLKAGQILILP